MWLESPAWEAGLTCQVSFYAAAFLVTSVVLWRMFRTKKHYDVPARDISKGHRWCPTDLLSHTAYCNICSSLVVDGAFCDSCGISTDPSCLKTADRTIHCKSLSGAGNSMRHHWIKGNLPYASICDVCEMECGVQAALTDYRCCWCQRTVHTNCQPMMADTCDLGRFKSFIVPPYCVRLKLVGWKGRRHLVVGEVRPPPYRPWYPLIVICNRKSGDNEGDLILRSFRYVLNPAQVIDLHDLPPESGLEWCNLISDQVCRILVAGGDGTIGWVLNVIEKLKIKTMPHICIAPLGTGNDLSRCLGWGEGVSGDLEVRQLLDSMSSAEIVSFDRWKVKISHFRHLGLRKPSKEVFMNNYFSVGVDALVALNFHKIRESKFYVFSSRLLNKFLYAGYGTKDILERECKNLHQKVKLFIDGRSIALPELEAIVVLNIQSWGAGVRLWEMGDPFETHQQSFNDGILEVAGVYSSFHIAQMQVGLSEPVKLGFGKHIQLILEAPVPVQVDGEPWEQSPAEINITFHRQVSMMSKRSTR